MAWRNLSQDPEVVEREAFNQYVSKQYGDLIESKAKEAITKSGMGGAQLQYMAYANANLLGISREDLKKRPELALKYAISRNIGEIAYQEYKRYKGAYAGLPQDEQYAKAIAAANAVVNDFMLPVLEKDPADFIRNFAASDKYGDMFVNYNGRKYETALTSKDLGSSGLAFIEKISDSTITGRLLSGVIMGEPLSIKQSLRGAAIMENLAGNDPMLSKEMNAIATGVSMAAGIAETMAVASIPGIGQFGIPAYIAAKGVLQNFTGAYGIRKAPDFGEIAAGAAFDFATSWAGITIGNGIVDTAIASRFAPKIVTGLTKTRLFDRYVMAGAIAPFANTFTDMAIDYGVFALAGSAGISMPQNMIDIYGQLSADALFKAFGKRIMMQAGSGMMRTLKEKAFRQRTGDSFPMFGTMEYSNKVFYEDVVGTKAGAQQRNKVIFNIQKGIAAIGYRMSPGHLQSVDAYVRAHAEELTGGGKDANLIQAIMDFSREEVVDAGNVSRKWDPTSFRPVVVASILLNGKAKADTIDTAFVGTHFWPRFGAFIFGGANRNDVRRQMVRATQTDSTLRASLGMITSIVDNNIKFVLNDENVEDFKDRVADLFYQHAEVVGSSKDFEGQADRIAGDLRKFLDLVIGVDEGGLRTTTNESLANDINMRIEQYRATPNITDQQRAAVDEAQKLVTKVIVDGADKNKMPNPALFTSEPRYTSRTDDIKSSFMRDMMNSSMYKLYGLAEGTNKERANKIFEATERVIDTFIRDIETNRELLSDPLARYYRSIVDAAYSSKDFSDAVEEIAKTMGSDRSDLNIKTVRSFGELKDKIINAGVEIVNNRIDSILRLADGRNMNAAVQNTRLASEIGKFKSMLMILSPSITQDQLASINTRLNNGLSNYKAGINTTLNPKLISEHSKLVEYLKNVEELTSSSRVRKTMLYGLVDAFSKLPGAEMSVDDLFNRFGDSMGWDEKTFARLVNAFHPYGMAIEARTNDDGTFYEYHQIINGSNVVYTDKDLKPLLEKVLSYYNMSGEKIKDADMMVNASRDLNLEAIAIVKRVFDQQLVKEFGDYRALVNIDQTRDAASIDTAIRETQKRLDSLVGKQNQFVLNGVTLGLNGDPDVFDIKLGFAPGENDSYKNFHSNYFKVFDVIDDRVNERHSLLDFTNNDNGQHRVNTAEPYIQVKSKNGVVRSIDTRQAVDDYGLFMSADVVSSFRYIVAAGMKYSDRADTGFQMSLLNAATDQLITSSPKLVSDVRRAIVDANPKMARADVDQHVKNSIQNIAAQQLRQMSRSMLNGSMLDVSAINTIANVYQYVVSEIGTPPKVARIGDGFRVNVSLEGKDQESVDKMVTLMHEYGLVNLGPAGANYEAVFMYYPKAEVTSAEVSRTRARQIIDDIARLRGDDNTRGKIHVYWSMDKNTGDITISRTAFNNSKEADILSYVDFLNVTRKDHFDRLAKIGSASLVNAANFEYVNKVTLAVESLGLGKTMAEDTDTTGVRRLNVDEQGRLISSSAMSQILADESDTIKTLIDDITKEVGKMGASSEEFTKDLDEILTKNDLAIIDDDNRVYADLLGTIAILSHHAKAFKAVGYNVDSITSRLDREINSTIRHLIDSDSVNGLIEMDANLGSMVYEDGDARMREHQRTIAKAVNKARAKTESKTWYNRYLQDPKSLTQDDLIRETLNMAVSGLRSVVMGSMESQEKRVSAMSLYSPMSFEQAETIFRRVFQQQPGGVKGVGFRLIYDGSPKGREQTTFDGTWYLTPEQIKDLDLQLGGYYGTGRKLVVNYAGSIMKIQVQPLASAPGEVSHSYLSIHNLKFLSSTAYLKLFTDEFKTSGKIDAGFGHRKSTQGVPDNNWSTVLPDDDAIRFIQSITLHSPQREALITSRTNTQTSMNDITFPLQSNRVSLRSVIDRLDDSYPSGMARGNSLNALWKRGDDRDNMGLYLPVASLASVYNTNLPDEIFKGINNAISRNESIFFSHDLTDKATLKFNVIQNHVMNSREVHSGDPGIFSSVGLGLLNVYQIASKRYETSLKRGNTNLEAAFKTITDALASGNVKLSRPDFERVTRTMLDYLVDDGFVARYYADDAKKSPLYFINVERSGIETPHHSGLFMISEIKNLDTYSWFGVSADWAARQSADFDGDNSNWRGVSQEQANKFLNKTRDTVGELRSDMDFLDAIAKYEHKVRRDESLRLGYSFEDDEVRDMYTPQSQKLAPVFGLFMGHQAKTIYPLLDAWRGMSNDRRLYNMVNSIAPDLVNYLARGTQMAFSPSEVGVSMREHPSLFKRNHNDVLVFSYLNKSDDIFSDNFIGGMKKTRIYKDLATTFGNKQLAEMSAISVVDEESGTRYIVIGKNDKKANGLDVLAMLRVNSEDDTDKALSRGINAMLDTKPGPAQQGSMSDISESLKARIAERLTESGVAHVNAGVLNNMRVIDGEDGLVYQMSKAGTDSPKNMFQQYFLRKFMGRDGNFDGNRALKAFEEALVKARVASNIMITRFDEGGLDYDYTGKGISFEGKALAPELTKRLSHDMSGFINKISEEVLDRSFDQATNTMNNTTLRVIEFANAVFDGASHKGSGPRKFGYTHAESQELIAALNRLPEDIASPAIATLRAMIKEVENNNNAFYTNTLWGRMHERLGKHASNTLIQALLPGTKLPFYTLTDLEVDNVIMPIDRAMKLLEDNTSEYNTRSRLMYAAKILDDTLSIQLSERVMSRKNVDINDFVDEIYSRLMDDPVSAPPTKTFVRDMIINRLGLDVSKETRLVYDGGIDPELTGIYDSRSSKVYGKLATTALEKSLRQDKQVSVPYLVDREGNKVTAEKLISSMRGLMADYVHDSVNGGVIRNVNSAIVNVMLGKSKMAMLLANEGITKKTAGRLANYLGSGPTWMIETLDTFNNIKQLNIKAPQDGAKLFNDYLLDKTVKILNPQEGVFDISSVCI